MAQNGTEAFRVRFADGRKINGLPNSFCSCGAHRPGRGRMFNLSHWNLDFNYVYAFMMVNGPTQGSMTKFIQNHVYRRLFLFFV